jgi:hypothetical protein
VGQVTGLVAGGKGAAELQKRVLDEAAHVLLVGLATSEGILPLTIGAIKDGLQATQSYYNKHTKEWDVLPDARTRVATAEFVFKQLVGLPVQKVEAKTLHADITPQAMDAVLAQSPALREALKRKIEAADAVEKRDGKTAGGAPSETRAGA